MKATTTPIAPPVMVSEERAQQLLERLCEIYTRNLRTRDSAGAMLAHHGLDDYAVFDKPGG
jgi:hypothetical protein